jgi:hypothetical protein
MSFVRRWIVVGVVLLGTGAGGARAESAWQRDGGCKGCHTVQYPALISVYGNDGLADPTGMGSLKVFKAGRSQAKSMFAQVSGLATGDQYAFAVTRFKYAGVVTSGLLNQSSTSMDCDWASWGGTAGTYSYPDFFQNWTGGPAQVSYDLTISATAAYDFYELIYEVAGRKSNGELFYGEEHFYLQVVGPNIPPLVAITAPAEGASFRPAPATITLTAAASDADGTIGRVEFYSGGDLLFMDTISPYQYVWNNVPSGSYTLTAKAIDSSGGITTSTAVHISVSGYTGDFDGDADVDQTDFAHLQLCLNGGVMPTDPACTDADLDGSGSIDTLDTVIFANCLSGPGVTPNPNCAP